MTDESKTAVSFKDRVKNLPWKTIGLSAAATVAVAAVSYVLFQVTVPETDTEEDLIEIAVDPDEV